MSPFLEFRNITKSFGKVRANDGISMPVERGRIHALLGENGSGKSTLMNILFGLVKRDSGEILLEGEALNFTSPLAAIRKGIGMIHQEFMLVQDLNVEENILLGVLEKDRKADMAVTRKKAQAMAEGLGLGGKLDTPVKRLSVGEMQKLEIVKTLFQGAELIVLDEPTGVLTPQESETLFEMLNNLSYSGKTMMLITHKLEEVLRYCDDVTVLRQGKSIVTIPARDTNKFDLAEKMVGRPVLFTLNEKTAAPMRERVCVKGLTLFGSCGGTCGINKLTDVSFSVYEREILGIAGVDGNGQQELADILAGVRSKSQGSYRIDGKPVEGGARALADRGISYIPGERRDVGVAIALSVEKNLILKTYNTKKHAKLGHIRHRQVHETVENLIETYHIKTESGAAHAAALSGGNLQKVVLARELSAAPKFLICVQPTRGLDVGAIGYVRNTLLAARESGVSILLISTELEEIVALSDRIAVLYEGRIVDVVDNTPDLDVTRIGFMMTGGKSPEHYEAGGSMI
jgi:simple sugar transport system ATP-binding protein